MEIDKPKVVIAGAGGGKTHQMITEIIKIMPELKNNPEKFCAIVTYTNSATEEIKDRVSKLVGIPNNLHISTTHSFLTKFIIEPYSHLYGYFPIDKNYIDSCNLQSWEEAYFDKIPNPIGRRIAKLNRLKKVATELSTNKGLIIYDKILETANLLITNIKINQLVSNRLGYIFVDEYQDMRLYQHMIFQSIISQGKTKFYCIGDPLQSIYNFTYGLSQLSKEPKPKNFHESPILELKRNPYYIQETINTNNRCSNNIIDFINNYNKIIGYSQELPKEKICNQIPLYFICCENKTDILTKFELIISKHQIQKEQNKMYSLLIAEYWNTFDDMSNVNSIITDSSSSTTIFKETSRIVLGSLGLNLTQALDILPFKEKREKILHFRQFCFCVLKDLHKRNYTVTNEHIVAQFISTFKVGLPDKTRKSIDVSKSIEKLEIVSRKTNSDKFCSSIHASKGLEATTVLVIAKTNKQLKKWLDFKNVLHDTDDDFRLGYVAFSRARELLCITCLEKPTEDIIEHMTKLKFEIN